VRGATERVVPIVMTALAAGLALVPIALSAGQPGSEIQAPMAMVIMCGLLSSTVLNMVAVPILYNRFGRPAGVPGQPASEGEPSRRSDANPLPAS
jgi:Cu/Ag efflux pump CusA